MDLPIDSQAARDLSWVINSPSLITLLDDSELSGTASDLQKASLVAALEGHLPDQPVHRVGRYFEQLVHFYLEAIWRFEIVAQGKQIQKDGQTLGEIDFLFRNASGEFCHLEAAVKFYLYLPDVSDCGSQFIGPNSADNFEKKMRRLFEHQLPLSKKWFPEVTQRLAFVKGRIFYHPLRDRPQCLPDPLSPAHLCGTWIRESELDLLETDGRCSLFKLVRKPHWLAPEVAAGDSTMQTLEEIKQSLRNHFQQKRTPQLVSRLAEDADCWRESDRIFIVADEWPAV